jgi:serine/threonine-protein kinase RsbW
MVTAMASPASSRRAKPRIQRDVTWSRSPVAPAPGRCTTYPAVAEAVGTARGEVVRIARAAGASKGALADIELAVSEASTNAVLHAYASAGVRGTRFTIATASRGQSFSVWVTDEGRGFAPDVPSPGLGLGLGLMASLCERVRLGVLQDGRTQVEMRFDLNAAETL